MKNLRNRINVKLVKSEKDYLKCTSKQGYMLHKIFDNNLVAIRKSRLASKLYKHAYTGMCILELNKVWMYKFHYDYIKNKYGNNWRLLFTDTDILMYESKTDNVYEDLSSNKEMFDFRNYSTKSKDYNNSNNLMIEKMKGETAGVAIKEFVGLKPKLHLFWVEIVNIKSKRRE